MTSLPPNTGSRTNDDSYSIKQQENRITDTANHSDTQKPEAITNKEKQS